MATVQTALWLQHHCASGLRYKFRQFFALLKERGYKVPANIIKSGRRVARMSRPPITTSVQPAIFRRVEIAAPSSCATGAMLSNKPVCTTAVPSTTAAMSECPLLAQTGILVTALSEFTTGPFSWADLSRYDATTGAGRCELVIGRLAPTRTKLLAGTGRCNRVPRMPRPVASDRGGRPPSDHAKCGVPMLLTLIEPIEPIDDDQRTFECWTCSCSEARHGRDRSRQRRQQLDQMAATWNLMSSTRSTNRLDCALRILLLPAWPP